MGRVALSSLAFSLLAFACASSEHQAPSPATATVVVEGRVIDLRGEPVPAANVRVLSPSEPRSELARGIANGEGIFRIEGVPYEQWWHVEAEVPGRYIGIATAKGDPATSLVHAHDATTVRGVLHDHGGEPVAGAVVCAFPTFWRPFENARLRRDAETDPEGRFVLHSVPLGATRLAAVVPGDVAEATVLVVPDCNVTLAPTGEPTTAITIEIPGVPAAALAATVLTIDATRKSMRVELPPALHTPPLGADGKWSIAAAPDYDYRVIARVPGYVISPHSGSVSRGGGPHHVVLQAEARDVRTLPCRVRIVDHRDAPLAGMPLRMFSSNHGTFADATTGADGTAVFASPCATGAYFGIDSCDARFALVDADGGEKPFDPARQIELRAFRTSSATARVEFADGRPAAFVMVAPGRMNSRRSHWINDHPALSDARGCVTIHGVVPARNTLDFRVSGIERLLVQDARGQGSARFGLPLEGDTREHPPIVLAPPASLEGVVRDANGNPAPGIRVRADSRDLVLQFVTITDGSGRYRFPCMPKGNASLYVWPPLAEHLPIDGSRFVSTGIEADRVHTLDLQLPGT